GGPGTLRLGVPLELPGDLLPRALAELSAAFPQTRVDISRASSAAQLVALEAGELDIALVRECPAPPASMRYSRLSKLWASCRRPPSPANSQVPQAFSYTGSGTWSGSDSSAQRLLPGMTRSPPPCAVTAYQRAIRCSPGSTP